MKKLFLLLSVFVLFCSCNKSKDFNTFENNQWYGSNPQNFEISIDNDTKAYNINLEFSYVFGSTFPEFPVQIAITSPSGKTETSTIPFSITAKNATTDCTGDVCDLSMPLITNKNLEKGVYKVAVSQFYKGEYLPNVIGVGIHFKEVK